MEPVALYGLYTAIVTGFFALATTVFVTLRSSKRSKDSDLDAKPTDLMEVLRIMRADQDHLRDVEAELDEQRSLNTHLVSELNLLRARKRSR